MAKLNILSKDLEKNPEFFYVLGAFEGDGHFNIKDGKVNINVCDIDFLEEIKRIFNKYSSETRIKIIKHTEAIGNSKEQRRINLCCRDFFNRGYHKLIPTTLEEKKYYLLGLMDAEGSVGIVKKEIKKANGKVYYGKDKWLTLCQVDITKLDLWASWLNELGIKTNKIYRKDSRSYLSIRRNDSIKIFYEKIGFKIKRKQEVLKSIVNNLGKSKLSEEDKGKIKKIYLHTNFGCTLIGKMFDRSNVGIQSILKFRGIKLDKNDCKISANDIDIAESILGRDLDFKIPNHRLLKFDVKNLKTSKIKSITFSKKEIGVDLYTPKYNNFFLDNGILSHNSTIAFQLAYFIAWMLAGGLMGLDKEKDYANYGKVIKKPDQEVRFSLDNVVFTADDLMKKAHELPKNSVIVYDEGRAGLDSKSAMMAINRVMEDFFQECGQYGHVILIVLPNFFKLHEDYATARSIFLIDVYHDEEFNRGYYNFYNKLQKEKLYFFGRRLIGTTAKYAAAFPNFYGRFSAWMPFDRKVYEEKKRKALDKKRLGKRDIKISKQRDILIFLYKNMIEKNSKELSDEIFDEFGLRISRDIIRKALMNALSIKEKKLYMDAEEKEEESVSV